MPIVVVVAFNLLRWSFILLIFCIHFLDFLLEVIWLIVIITLSILPIVFTLIWWLITEYLSAVIKRVIIMLFIILYFNVVVVIFNLTLHLRLIISVNWLRLYRACTNLPILSLLHFLKQTDYTGHKKRWFLHNALIFFIHQHLLDIKLPHHTLMFREYFSSI